MLSIRNAEPNDYKDLEAFMEKEGLDVFDPSLRETMLLVDDALILGYASAALVNLRPTIDSIYIPEKLRGHLLGDAVLRGLLFYFMNRGFETAYAIQSPETEAFLTHMGFIAVEEGLAVDLESFFDRKCRGCKDVK